MPSNWSMVDSSFPTFRGDEKPREQISALVNYMHILVEELKFQLENLDAGNWNTTALKTFQTDTTADVSEQLSAVAASLQQVTNEVAEINGRLSAVENLTGRMNQAETDISFLEKAQEETENRLDALDDQMGDVQAGIDGLQTDMDGLQGDVDGLQTDVEEVRRVIKPDGSGGATVGSAGQAVYLVGQIYINGKLME